MNLYIISLGHLNLRSFPLCFFHTHSEHQEKTQHLKKPHNCFKNADGFGRTVYGITLPPKKQHPRVNKIMVYNKNAFLDKIIQKHLVANNQNGNSCSTHPQTLYITKIKTMFSLYALSFTTYLKNWCVNWIRVLHLRKT